jgi:hypothetical protein
MQLHEIALVSSLIQLHLAHQSLCDILAAAEPPTRSQKPTKSEKKQ